MPQRVAALRRASEGVHGRAGAGSCERAQMSDSKLTRVATAQLKFSSRLQRPLGQHAPQA